MRLTYAPLADHPVERAAAVMHRAFQGYVGGEMSITPAVFAQLTAGGEASPAFSTIALDGDTPVALALIARRGWRIRLAAMGVVPEAKGRGVGKALLAHLITRARERDERVMELECFEQNTPGMRLYRGAGFVARRKLLGYSGTIEPGPGDPVPIDPAELADHVARHGVEELPWQVSAPSLLRAGHPQRAYRLGAARALVGVTDARVQLSAVVTDAPARGRGEARALLRSIAARHAGTWHVAPLCPEELGGFFETLWLRPERLNQVQMILPLVPLAQRTSTARPVATPPTR